ncbi:hypothetical protein AVEN_66651-1 [Araneus ventricosus]|uniref:Uncharacterized protein n=1 Tax=Araneus ventricosus TaxID=182803 RepID=A0A4Y2PIB8_ARAVE|nr:hypothetical protein AVEN_66651-1 [Araneus ventricosus]
MRSAFHEHRVDRRGVRGRRLFCCKPKGRVFEAEALLPRTPPPAQRCPGPSLLSAALPGTGHLCPFPAGHPQIGGAFCLSGHSLVDTSHTNGRAEHHRANL